MQAKDQIRLQMDRLGVSPRELAKRIETSEQTIRFWMAGRSYPAKKRVADLEAALSFKLDFSEGGQPRGPTVESTMEAADIGLFLKLRKLPPSVRVTFEKLVDALLGTVDPIEPFNERVAGAKGVAPFSRKISEAGNQNAKEQPRHSTRRSTK